MLDKEYITSIFEQQFGYKNTEFCFSPGRVNLIGEHIDYNGGFVLPFAIDKGILAGFCKNNSEEIRIYAKDFDEMLNLKINEPIILPKQIDWITYVLGVLKIVQEKHPILSGIDLVLCSDLPQGSGLSSSASLECLIAYVFATDYYENNRKELALDAQKAEHLYAGVRCGIMDQFAVANGKKNHALLLDCHNVSAIYIPFNLKDYTLLVLNSQKPRNLIESKYNERREECEEIMTLLKGFDPATELVNINPMSLAYIEDDILYARAKHVVSENNRVKMACNALSDGDIEALGQLLNQSHESLSIDYEVSGIELDTLVKYALNVKECIGARMTGAGFGGCCIAIVETTAINKFKKYVTKKYREKIGYECSIFETNIVDGVQ